MADSPAAKATVPSLAEQLIAASFKVSSGQLVIAGFPVPELMATYGSPLYVYDGDIIVRQFGELSRAVAPLAEVFYSIKANPNPAIARLLVGEGAGLEIASAAELALALRAGCKPRRILFAGPGKGASEIAAAMAAGVGEIHLESFEEIACVAALARNTGRRVKVSIRVNPVAAAQGGAMRMGGKPAAFGFDEEIVGEVIETIARHNELDLVGLHLFAGTQILDAEVLLAQWRHGLMLAATIGRRIGRPLASIDLGGGLGIPYHDGDRSLDIGRLAEVASDLRTARKADPYTASADVVIEPGRYLVGPAGVYLVTVRAVKTSRGERFAIADGGMHHHLAASGNLGQVIKRDYPIVAANRLDAAIEGPASVVGPLCTPLDTLARRVALPALAAGDVIAVLQSGAYGLSASPVGFLSHPMPAEVLIQAGRHELIRPAGRTDAPLVNL